MVGPNGSGKSTLLARISGLLDGEGRVELDGMPICLREIWRCVALICRSSKTPVP
nr:ATP-binding cassette domain-containing protein [Candidatus Symbiopectobacterium sp. 'North America']